MSAPEVGDLVLYEGVRWRVIAEGLVSLQRFGDEFRPVGEGYLVLRADGEGSGGEQAREAKVPKSRWNQIEVLSQ